MNHVVIGLAGHIDHGKTSIVEALTGTNTDVLKDEQKRGMTIDIGFAFLNQKITLIDVPGHEKFVKNMMAGVSGIDGALLVVAADDGVMPQTKEHINILELLGVKKIIVALTKIDLVDKEWIELVELEIQEIFDNSSIIDYSINRVSVIKNTGIEKLKNKLIDFSKIACPREDSGIFRLPIDRVFTVKGFGTVVTGTVHSGKLNVGQNIEILPANLITKVRGIQCQGNIVKSVQIGDRAAINLQGLSKKIIQRGFQCVELGSIKTTREIGATVQSIRSLNINIKQNQRIRVYSGTMEVLARVSILDKKVISPGEIASVILKLEEPIPLTMNDKFIIRRYSPVITIGGGKVLDIQLSEKWNQKKKYVNIIANSNENEKIKRIIDFQNSNPINKKDIRLKFGLSELLFNNKIKQITDIKYINDKNETWLVTTSQLKRINNFILNEINSYQKKNRLKPGILFEELHQKISGDKKFLENRIKKLEEEKKIKRIQKYLSSADFSIQFSENEKEIYNKILRILDKENFYSSSINDFSILTEIDKNYLIELIKVGELKGEIIRLTETLMFTENNFKKLKVSFIKFLDMNESITVSEFKEIANTSRKFAVPLLEYFDRLKITYRVGDKRKLVK